MAIIYTAQKQQHNNNKKTLQHSFNPMMRPTL